MIEQPPDVPDGVEEPPWQAAYDPTTDPEYAPPFLTAEALEAEKAEQEKARADRIAGQQKSIEEYEEAKERARAKREEAAISGELAGEAAAFYELTLKPRMAEAHDFNPPIRTPVVQGLFDRNSLSWVAGPSGTFKSFVTADLAFRYGAEDMDFHGRKMTHGRALIIVAEGEAGYAHRRVAWEAQYGREVKNVTFYPGALQLANIQRDMPALLHYLKEEAEAGQPYSLIMIDTQAMCTVGIDENSPLMNLAINVLHRIRQTTGACILVVHHFGKDASKGMRGSSMQYAAADTVLVLKRDADAMTVKLSTAQADGGKQKDGATEKDFLELEMKVHATGVDYFGDDVTSLAAVKAVGGSTDISGPAGDTPEGKPLPEEVTEIQMGYLKALNYYEGDGATQSDLAAKINDDAGDKVTYGSKVRTAMVGLKKDGLVEQKDGGSKWYVTPRGEAVLMRDLIDRARVGEGWVERAGRGRRGRGPGADDSMIE